MTLEGQQINQFIKKNISQHFFTPKSTKCHWFRFFFSSSETLKHVLPDKWNRSECPQAEWALSGWRVKRAPAVHVLSGSFHGLLPSGGGWPLGRPVKERCVIISTRSSNSRHSSHAMLLPPSCLCRYRLNGNVPVHFDHLVKDVIASSFSCCLHVCTHACVDRHTLCMWIGTCYIFSCTFVECQD